MRRAFTLIEAALALLALGLLAAIAIPTYTTLMRSAQEDSAERLVQAYALDVRARVALERQVDPTASLDTCPSCWSAASERLDGVGAQVNGVPAPFAASAPLILTEDVMVAIHADAGTPTLVSVSTDTAQAQVVDDGADPQVSVASPVPGQVLSGSVEVLLEASDDLGIARVEILINAVVRALHVGPASSISVDLAGLALGEALLVARVTDVAGKQSSSAPVLVRID